jgi:hypothetical protein
MKEETSGLHEHVGTGLQYQWDQKRPIGLNVDDGF